MSYEIRGKLVDPTSPSKLLSNYTIEAFDKDPFPGSLFDDELGKAITLDDGSFRIKFKASDFRDILETGDPQLYFKIYDLDGALIHTTDVITPLILHTQIHQK